MLDLELFSDPVLEIDNNFTIVKSNSFFNQFYDISKRKVNNKKLNDLFELDEEFYNQDVPYQMLVPKELGILFGSTLSQNVQLFKTKHPDFEGYSLLHFKDVDAEVRLHNKNLRQIRGQEDGAELASSQILTEILDQEHCAVFKLKENKVECLHFHILPELKERTLEAFAKYLNKNFSPNTDWENFFKILSMKAVDLNDISDLIPDKLEYKNRYLTLKLISLAQDNSIIFLFKDISEKNQDDFIRENQKVLSHFYSLFIKKPTLLNLFLGEIKSLLSDENKQNLRHSLHSLKGLLYFIGLKKFAEDVHILEFLTEESKKESGFEELKIKIKKFIEQNTSQAYNITVDKGLLDAFNIPHEKYVSIQSMIQNIDELSQFYLEFIPKKYLKIKGEPEGLFITKKLASTLLTIFNHLIRNVGAHGDETSFKLQFIIEKETLSIRTENIVKEKSLTKIEFLSGSDIGVNIMEELSEENDIKFYYEKKKDKYSNQLDLNLLNKEDLT